MDLKNDMNPSEQLDILLQGTDYGDATLAQNMRRELAAKLQEGRPLRVYCGYDPTATDLHLGHTISMRKLRQFQDLGHDVTFLIGNYTALVGDPSDKNKARPILTEAQVSHNAQTFVEQAYRVLDPAKTTVRYNKDWLSQLTLLDLIRLGQNFTIQQFLARDNFAKRIEKGDAIYLHEAFYALMQGYDAVAMQTDVQVGGRDQLFNIVVAGRKLQEAVGQKPQVAVITGILPGTDGVQRMSKSMGNHIPIGTTASDMYGKVMSIPDAAMPAYFELATRWQPAEVAERKAGLVSGQLHPRDAKMALAYEITEIFYGSAGAQNGQEHFQQVFQKGHLPSEIPSVSVAAGQALLDVLVLYGGVASKSEARRLVEQGAVRLGGDKVSDPKMLLQLAAATVLQVGKHKFVELHPLV